MEGETDVMTAAEDLVDDVDTAGGPVQPNRAAVPGWRVKRQVAVVLCGPFDGVANVLDINFPGVGVAQPQEGTAFA